MNTNQSCLDRAPQSTQPIELCHPAWLKNGDSPAEIILSTAILVSAIAKLITASRTAKKW
jgi:hypothetical protein